MALAQIMLSNHPQTAVFLGSAIKNNAQPNKAEHYLSVCTQLYLTGVHQHVGFYLNQDFVIDTYVTVHHQVKPVEKQIKLKGMVI